ncbi:hypothetical protein GWO43_19295 [candidate division KSB1 bacterium]|nr:hypothetical protein [candidate division KSB1 bacterium]NIR70531.1 hypothetical protein [candidate division KSB1 bacterium]NIT72982.1 hypothetical protein [candidate division KSB1 bacterium]NIU26851.1 hypothetical protein [candidate division KSB1 bacterium]NIU92382.1 hypothetical protein [candidate division KSB1 bacterium]
MAEPKGLEARQASAEFHILQEHYIQEQAFYWQRFSAFAGLFVLASSNSITKRWLVDWLGAVLGFIWVLVQ